MVDSGSFIMQLLNLNNYLHMQNFHGTVSTNQKYFITEIILLNYVAYIHCE